MVNRVTIWKIVANDSKSVMKITPLFHGSISWKYIFRKATWRKS